MELFSKVVNNPNIVEIIMDDKRMITSGRDYIEEAKDVYTGNVSQPTINNTQE